jgi:hypothetical protein
MTQLQQARHELPIPPSSILATPGDVKNQLPSDLVDRQYKLTTDAYRRILYTDSWITKDKFIRQYMETVDTTRDTSVQHLGEVHCKLIKRHNLLQRKNKEDVEQLAASQSIQTSLFQQTQRLNLANKALKQLNIQHNTNAKKAVRFEDKAHTKETATNDKINTNAISGSPLKKTKLSAATGKPNAALKTKLVRSPSVKSTSKSTGITTPTKASRSPSHLTKSPSQLAKTRKGSQKNTNDTATTDDTTSTTDETNTITDDSDIEITRVLRGRTEEDSDDDIESTAAYLAQHEERLNTDSADNSAEDNDEFGFGVFECAECVPGSGRNDGHSGRHTRTKSKAPSSSN